MTERNREAVGRRLDRLRERYDPPVAVLDERLPPERFETLLSMTADGYTGGGYAWTVRRPEATPALSESMPEAAGPHVLLVLGREQPASRWTLPGGGREDGETYEDAARREVREETGVEVDLGAPYLVVRARTTAAGHDTTVHTLWVHFDARYAGGTLDLQTSELRGGAWFVEPPGALSTVAARRGGEFWEAYDPPAAALELADDGVEVRWSNEPRE